MTILGGMPCSQDSASQDTAIYQMALCCTKLLLRANASWSCPHLVAHEKTALMVSEVLLLLSDHRWHRKPGEVPTPDQQALRRGMVPTFYKLPRHNHAYLNCRRLGCLVVMKENLR